MKFWFYYLFHLPYHYLSLSLKRSIPKIFLNGAENYIFGIVRKMKAISSKFPYYRRTGNPHQDAEKAAKIINLNAQFGEGWSIPAESGINNVISLQPFG